ncbi:MAG: metallophosphoesterase [Thermoplasmata archaeon]|nr:metallophosphoesterase [Thermoplasmata archaeon]
MIDTSPLPERWLTPEAIHGLSPEEADHLIDQLEAAVPVSPGLVRIPGAPLEEAIVFGDTHGDWRSTVAVARRFLESPETRCLVGLGDYVDRSPTDCENGGVLNVLYLLGLRAVFPDRVILIQGNHETVRRLAVVPHTLPEEVDDLWGPEVERYQRILGLLERGPLAAVTSSGVYLAHGGFPEIRRPEELNQGFEPADEDGLLHLVWQSPDASQIDRGLLPPFTDKSLRQFLKLASASLFLRGHDPDVVGRPLYGGHCVTLHTSRIYERYGGVLLARVPLNRPVLSSQDISLEHLETEGKEFPDVGESSE